MGIKIPSFISKALGDSKERNGSLDVMCGTRNEEVKKRKPKKKFFHFPHEMRDYIAQFGKMILICCELDFFFLGCFASVYIYLKVSLKQVLNILNLQKTFSVYLLYRTEIQFTVDIGGCRPFLIQN